jgi:hypothetical protein
MVPSKSIVNTADVNGTFFDATACNIAAHILREGENNLQTSRYKATGLYRREQVMGEQGAEGSIFR